MCQHICRGVPSHIVLSHLSLDYGKLICSSLQCPNYLSAFQNVPYNTVNSKIYITFTRSSCNKNHQKINV